MNATQPVTNRILRAGQAAEFLSVSRSTLWRFAKDEKFPPKIQLGTKSCGWREADLSAWLTSREVH